MSRRGRSATNPIELSDDEATAPEPRAAAPSADAPSPKRARTGPSIRDMKEAIRRAGYGTADLFERADVEARYRRAAARLAEADRRATTDASASPAARPAATARPSTASPARQTAARPPPAAATTGARCFRLELDASGRPSTSWHAGVPPLAPNYRRDFRGAVSVQLNTRPDGPRAAKETVEFVYDAAAARPRAEPYTPARQAYKSSNAVVDGGFERYGRRVGANGATLLKSLLQKCCRRQMSYKAARAAHELLCVRKSGGMRPLLKRLLVISVEDSAPLRGVNSALVWFYVAACADRKLFDAAREGQTRYQMTRGDVEFVLGAVQAVAVCPVGPTKNVLRKPPGPFFLPAVPPPGFADVAFEFLLVANFAASWDKALLCWAGAHFTTPDALTAPTPPSLPITLATLELPELRLRPEGGPNGWLLDAVDTKVGCYGTNGKEKIRPPVLDVLFMIEPDLEEETRIELEDWMCNKRSMVQKRYKYPDPRIDIPANHVEWHEIADEAARRIIAAAVVANPPW